MVTEREESGFLVSSAGADNQIFMFDMLSLVCLLGINVVIVCYVCPQLREESGLDM